VEYERNKDENKDKNNEEEYWYEAPDYELYEELDDEQAYDRIGQDEIDEILAEPGQVNENGNANITNREVQQNNNDQPENAVTNDGDDGTVAMESSRPARERKEPE
jgi:hypothetical protein